MGPNPRGMDAIPLIDVHDIVDVQHRCRAMDTPAGLAHDWPTAFAPFLKGTPGRGGTRGAPPAPFGLPREKGDRNNDAGTHAQIHQHDTAVFTPARSLAAAAVQRTSVRLATGSFLLGTGMETAGRKRASCGGGTRELPLMGHAARIGCWHLASRDLHRGSAGRGHSVPGRTGPTGRGRRTGSADDADIPG